MRVSTGIYSRSSEILEKVQDLSAATKGTKIGYCSPLCLVASEIRPLASFVPDIGAYLPVPGRTQAIFSELPRRVFSEVANTYLEVPCSYASTANLLKRAKSVT